MILHNEKEQHVNEIVELFMNHISKCDLTSYFEINVSDNIEEDYTKFDNTCRPSADNNYAGFTILPNSPQEKIQILISENLYAPDVVLHELTHMYDFVLFSHYFCKDKLYEIKSNKYYQILIYWSEFHVKQVDIPYTHLLIDAYSNTSKENLLHHFKSQIKTFYYPKYNSKFLNKTNPIIRDIMWYLGELYVCNTYDENNTYSISQDILNIYGSEIIKLNNLVLKCPTFLDFASNIEEFYNYFRNK